MKVLQLGDNDLCGNRFNGHDLHQYLRQRDIVADHLVRTKRSDDPDTYVMGYGIDGRVRCNAMVALAERKVGTHALHYPFTFSIFSDPRFLDADIVHYHLLHNYYFNLNLLPNLTALKPSVWTIHDPWIATGHCIYPLDCERWKTGCGDCPYPDTRFPLEFDTSALNWDIKKDILGRCRLDIVVASKFMLDLVKQSPILSHFDVHHIPFGLDLTRFIPADVGNARKRLDIPHENVVVCFRADKYIFKGFDYIKKALERLSVNTPVTLLSVGERNLLSSFYGRFQVIDMGWLADDDTMLDVYRAADVFLMPSAVEAFGMMAIEAMACGKPVIVFEGTSLPATIFAPEGGIAVPQGDAAALSHELKDLIQNKEKRLRLGRQARKLAEQHYDKDVYVSKIIDLYKEVCAKRSIDGRSEYIIGQLKNNVRKLSAQNNAAVTEIHKPTAKEVLAYEGINPIDELMRIKSSIYYRVFDSLRKKRSLQFIANAAIKPAFHASMRVIDSTKKIVNRVFHL